MCFTGVAAFGFQVYGHWFWRSRAITTIVLHKLHFPWLSDKVSRLQSCQSGAQTGVTLLLPVKSMECIYMKPDVAEVQL